MNKTELIAKVAEATELTKADSAKAVNATFDAIKAELAAKGSVQVIGFGTFSTRERAARTGRNPRTGEAIKVKASTVPAFKAGATLKSAVNAKPKATKKAAAKKSKKK